MTLKKIGNFFFLIFLLSFPLRLFGQPELNISKKEAFPGEKMILTLSVPGELNEIPSFTSPSNEVKIEYLGAQEQNFQSISILNGQRTVETQNTTLYRWSILSFTPGSYRTNPIEVTWEKKKYALEPFYFFIKNFSTSNDFFFEEVLTPHQTLKGLSFTYTLTFYFKQNIRTLSFLLPILENPSIKLKEVFSPDQSISVPVNQTEYPFTRGTRLKNNSNLNYLEFKASLIPLEEGTLTFDPSSVFLEYEQGSSFFSLGRERRSLSLKSSSSPSLLVESLPRLNAPTPFSGLIGTPIILKSSLMNSSHFLGDPIELKISLEGIANDISSFGLRKAFEASLEQAGFQILPVDSSIQTPPSESSSVSFLFKIRTWDPQIKGIPALEVNFYHLQEKKYSRALAPFIPLYLEKRTDSFSSVPPENSSSLNSPPLPLISEESLSLFKILEAQFDLFPSSSFSLWNFLFWFIVILVHLLFLVFLFWIWFKHSFFFQKILFKKTFSSLPSSNLHDFSFSLQKLFHLYQQFPPRIQKIALLSVFKSLLEEIDQTRFSPQLELSVQAQTLFQELKDKLSKDSLL